MDVTLTLKADNSQHIQKLKEAQAATQKLYEEHVKGEKQATTAIQKEIAVLEQLKAKRNAATKENKADYNAQITESRKRIQIYQSEGDAIEKTAEKTQKSGSLISKGMMIWGTAIAGVTAALGFLKSAMESTGPTAVRLAEMTEGVREGFDAIKRAVIIFDFI